jgi:hypothetical protein
MSRDVSPVLSESFEDVLGAVKETARGRWFLDQYTERRKSEDTAAILAAIAKLEIAISRMSPAQQKAEPDVLTRAKSAIADAKQQIRGIVTRESPLSKEAQLFAKLAELSRQALAEVPDDPERKKLGASMEVALKLVSDLEQSFGEQDAPVKQVASGARFFSQDAEIFEPIKVRDTATPQAANTQQAMPKPETQVGHQDSVQRGARVTISRTGNASTATKPEFQDTAPLPTSAVVVQSTPPATPASTAQDNQPSTVDLKTRNDVKVVTINRKPDESIGVPLFEDSAEQAKDEGNAA